MSVHDTRIEAGVRLLDEQMPGWEQHVDFRSLDLNSCTDCVVGQLLNIPEDDLLYLGFKSLGVERPHEYGFALDWDLGYRATYGGLTRAWKARIRQRLRRRAS